jgi:hypothetical protein
VKSKYPPEERARRNKAKAKEWREANQDRLREYMAGWRERNRQKLRDWQIAYHKAHPMRHRDRTLRAKYGITVEDFRDMLVGQAGRCLICHRVPPTDLVVDHDHGTGRVRGLLCQRCNRMLGHVDERPEILRSAIRYLGEAA